MLHKFRRQSWIFPWALTGALGGGLAFALAGGLAFAGDAAPLLLVANYSENTLRLVNDDGSTEVVASAAEGLAGPFGSNALALDNEGRLYVANYNARQIVRFPSTQPAGEIAEVFADAEDGIDTPDGLAFSGGTLYVANREGGTILTVDAEGSAAVFDHLSDVPVSIAAGPSALYVATEIGAVYRYTGYIAANRQLIGFFFGGNMAIAVGDNEAVLYVADQGSVSAITLVSPFNVSSVAGNMAGADEGLVVEQSDGVDAALYVSDFAGRIYRVDLFEGNAVTLLAQRSNGLSGPSGLLLVTPATICAGFTQCDANCDGQVNNFDIEAFVLAITNPTGYQALYPNCSRSCSSDLNGDGEANNFDIDLFVACIVG